MYGINSPISAAIAGASARQAWRSINVVMYQILMDSAHAPRSELTLFQGSNAGQPCVLRTKLHGNQIFIGGMAELLA
ncbi:MAG: hypothetical protein V4724_11295 [Pseudomonadota bacterium]